MGFCRYFQVLALLMGLQSAIFVAGAHAGRWHPTPKSEKHMKLELWFQELGIKNIERKFPEAFTSSVERLTEKVEWLRALGVQDIGKFITAQPSVLGSKIETLIERSDWLQTQGVRDIGKALRLHPALLSYSVEKNLAPKLDLLKKLGVRNTGKVLNSFPAIFGLSENHIQFAAEFLKSEGSGDLGSLIEGHPQLLSYNVEKNLRPKLEELEVHWGFSREAVLNQNYLLLSASLPRLKALSHFLESAGYNVKVLSAYKRRTIAFSVSVDMVLHNLNGLDVKEAVAREGFGKYLVKPKSLGKLPCEAVIEEESQ